MPIDVKKLDRRPLKGGSKGAMGYWRKEDGVQVCGSKRRKKPVNSRCNQSTGLSPTSGRCKHHGGHPDSGRPVTKGIYSEVKLGRIRDAYDALREHELLRDGDQHLALSGAWIQYLFDMAAEGDGPDFRELAVAKFGQMELAMQKGDKKKLGEALGDLKRHLLNGMQSMNTMREAIAASDKRQWHVNKAAELHLKADQQLTEKTFTSLVTELVEIILRLAPQDVANKILNEIRTQTVAGGHRLGHASD